MIATLLDFDGVLVDSEPAHLAAFNDALATFGIFISDREYSESYLSLDDAGVLRAVLSRGGRTLREEDVRAGVAAKAARFMVRFADSFRAFPGAAALVTRRAARGPVGIVSGALEPEIAFALKKMGVRGDVAFVVSAERTPVSKPDPSPFLLAVEELRRLGHTGSAVVVEDSIGGVTSAVRAGISCVGVTHSYSSDELLRAGAAAAVDGLDALTDTLLDGLP
ncbi:MAG: HAD family hydrolase [Polyangiaceae bacterium]